MDNIPCLSSKSLLNSKFKKLDDLSQVKYGRSNRCHIETLIIKKIKKQQKNERIQSN